MHNVLVNPHTQVHFLDDEQKSLLLLAPKQNFGLQTLKITKPLNSSLYDVFEDLAKVRLDFLDIEEDINDEERELLCQYGVLVAPENVPQKPLFACPLNDVENAEFSDADSALVVNPHFHFEPVNLNNFDLWIREKHLSPYQATVWIKTLLTEIEIGYWLDAEQAEIVSTFTPGEKLPFVVEKDFLSKLIAAEILVSDEISRRRAEVSGQLLKQARKDFAENKYSVLRNLLPPTQMRALRKYFREYARNGFMPLGDDQVELRYYQHNEPLATFFHQNLAKVMSLVAGEEVRPSYVYAASYLEGARLAPHTDRPQCEFSFSLQVDYLPEQKNHLSPWGLFVAEPDKNENYSSKKFPAPDQAADSNEAVYLASGDALIYKGCELVHYRYELPAGHQSTSLFFHYVPANFQGNLS